MHLPPHAPPGHVLTALPVALAALLLCTGAALIAGARTAWAGQERALLYGVIAAAALLLLLWFGIAALLDRREAAALRRIAQAAAAQKRDALREVSSFFAGLPVAVWRGEIFPDGTVLVGFLSPGVTRITGLGTEQASEPGQWRDRLDAESLAVLEDFHARLLREGEAVAEYAFRHQEGRQVWLREQARIIGPGAQGGAEVAGVITDITGERRLSESAAMSAKLAALGKMTASIAHELTQPLGAISLASETALAALPEQGGKPVDAARARVTRIGQQAERARTLIDHLRAFGREDSGTAEAVVLDKALEGALLLTGPLLQTAGIELIVDVPKALPPLRGRPILLEQVLVNLIVNARDAMAKQPDGERRLAFRAAAEEGGVTLTVQDSGPGLPEGMLDRIFEPFFTTKPAGQGTGLGLSICHSILASFGGGITAHNTDQGACFTLGFRIWQPPAEQAQAEGT